MKFKLLTIIITISTSLFAQEQLTLQKAIELALDNNYGIKIAQSNQQLADNNFTLGNAGFLPEVTADFNKTYGVQDFERTLASGVDQSQTGAQNERTSYGANLNWTIFDGMRMFASYDQLNVLKAQSEESLKAEIELLIFNITTTFYQTALERERLILYDSNVLFSEQRLKVAKDKYELGKASKLEYLQAQVDLNSDKSQKITQQQTLTATKLELIRLMGVELDEFSLTYSLTDTEELELQDLINGVESQNPQLSALKKQELIASYDEKLNRGNMLPQVNLFAGYNHIKSESPAGFALVSTTDDITYGLSASWTLFNGFNVQRQVQNAKIQKDISTYQYDNQLNNFKTAIKQGYAGYSNSLELLDLEESNLAVARENNDISKERYVIGLSTPLELREAQLNYLNAELRYQNAAFNAKLAVIELKYLSGRLIE